MTCRISAHEGRFHLKEVWFGGFYDAPTQYRPYSTNNICFLEASQCLYLENEMCSVILIAFERVFILCHTHLAGQEQGKHVDVLFVYID